MVGDFDANILAEKGWRQGSVLSATLAKVARVHSPAGIEYTKDDWLIITSHDCDVVNKSLDKEPRVELLVGRPHRAPKPDKGQAGGRNPRTLELVIPTEDGPHILKLSVHDRWTIPRELLEQEAPATCLPDKERRLVAEWLAKRYIRAAFPTSFDQRWRQGKNLSKWTKLLNKYSEWIQGVYLRLSTDQELSDDKPYRCHLILAVPDIKRSDSGWGEMRNEIETKVSKFWEQFDPSIIFDGCDVRGTDEITIADLEPYKRFDADWLSFADDSPTIPPTVDMGS